MEMSQQMQLATMEAMGQQAAAAAPQGCPAADVAALLQQAAPAGAQADLLAMAQNQQLAAGQQILGGVDAQLLQQQLQQLNPLGGLLGAQAGLGLGALPGFQLPAAGALPGAADQTAQLLQAMQAAQAAAQGLLAIPGAANLTALAAAGLPGLAAPAAASVAAPNQEVNLQIHGLPLSWTDSEIATFFSQFGEVFSARALPAQPGKSTLSGMVRMALAEANWVIQHLSGNVETARTVGLPGPVTIQVVDELGREIARRASSGPEVPLQTCEVEESDNLYVKGLPGDFDDDKLAQVFGQYGTVTQTKVLPPKPLPDKSILKVSGFVRMSSVEEAKQIITTLNGQIPNGLNARVTIGFAGDGVPLVHKLAKKLANGEDLHQGIIRAYNFERRNGFITCDEVYKQSNCEVYAHHNVMDRAHAGPGDTCIFVVYWKNEKPQAALPLLRVCARTVDGQTRYALKGWYRGISDPETGVGAVESADLRTVLAKETVVPKEIAQAVNPGWVCFNAKLEKIGIDGLSGPSAYIPVVVAMESCHEAWKPEPADLTKTWEIGPAPGKGGSKGNGARLKGKGDDDDALSSLGKGFGKLGKAMFGKLGKSWEDGDAWWEQMQQMFMMMKGKKGKLMEGKGMDSKGAEKGMDWKGMGDGKGGASGPSMDMPAAWRKRPAEDDFSSGWQVKSFRTE
mmetsp:Transcript_52485/g.97159  ORF Transcript_52485/g.97159 Transcript_52485/m.97159 type:complete len:681 (-) Transcript_52485:138-2180(-)